MLPKNVLYYGREDPLPRQVELRAGPLSLVYEEGDLRYVRLGEREVIRRIYVATRDRNWGTLPNVLSNVQMEIAAGAFRISYEVENKQGEIDFFWRGTITGDAQGTLTFAMDGEARSTFMRNRIGFCVLHPASCAGAQAVVEHTDGSTEEGDLPIYLVPAQPVQPFADVRAIRHQVTPGVWAELRFSGDVFEMEDQRNWTDASYKTFCTPLRLPYPVEVRAGTKVAQSVTLGVREQGAGSRRQGDKETRRPGAEDRRQGRGERGDGGGESGCACPAAAAWVGGGQPRGGAVRAGSGAAQGAEAAPPARGPAAGGRGLGREAAPRGGRGASVGGRAGGGAVHF